MGNSTARAPTTHENLHNTRSNALNGQRAMSNAKSCHAQARKKTNKHALKHVIKQRTPLPAQLQQQQRNKSSPNRQQRRRQRRRRRRFPQQRNHRTNSMATRRRRTTTRGCVLRASVSTQPQRPTRHEKKISKRPSKVLLWVLGLDLPSAQWASPSAPVTSLMHCVFVS